MNSIHDICKKYGIKNYIVNDDGSIDVNGDVDLCDNGLTEFPLIFNKVTGNFICDDNQLTTLKGCPRWIGGYFDCDCNRLYSLEFSPDYVGSYFSCELNYLTDNYCETEIGTNFFTSIKQDGLIFGIFNSVINYEEWRKTYKRKQTLEKIFNI